MRLGRRRSEMKENTLDDSPDNCQIWPEVLVTSTGQSDTDTVHTVALGPGVSSLPH